MEGYSKKTKGERLKIVTMAMIAALAATGASAAQIAIKAETLKFDYMETDQGQNLDSERANFGKIKGVDVSIRAGNGVSRNANNKADLISELSMSYNSGDTEYVGSYLGVPGSQYGDVVSTTSNKLTEMTYKLGFLAPVSDTVFAGLNVGAGVRIWERNLNDGNIETYRWGVLSAGGEAGWKVTTGGVISLSADWQRAYHPTMDSTLVNGTFNLGKTSGYKLGLHWIGNITRSLAFEADYIYDYWKISRSNYISDGAGGYYFEPDSETKNQRLKAGFSFAF